MSVRRRSLIVGALAVGLGACSELPVSTTEQAVTVSPPSTDFGVVTVGTEVGPRYFTVSYGTGFGNDTVVDVQTCPDFRVDLEGQVLPAEIWRICETTQKACSFIDVQTFVFAVYFRPSVANIESCTMTIDFGSAAPKLVSLTGTGAAPPIDLTIVQPSAPSLDFGDVLVGQTSAARTVTVRSDGGGNLDISGATASGPGFASTGTAPISLAPTTSTDYQVTCAPPAPGVTTGTFRLTSNDPDEALVDIALRCNGIQSNLDVTPSPATLPPTRVGETSSIPIRLINTCTAALSIEGVAIAGDALSITAQPGTLSLGPGAFTELTVGFAPTADGDVSGTLTVTFDGGQTRQLGLTGPGRVATLSVAPSGEVDFGPICVGQSASEVFVALDTGTGGFRVDGVAPIGAGFTVTPIAPTTYPAPLQPLGADTVTFQVVAAPAAAGEASGGVEISTDIPGLAKKTIGLHALGLEGGTSVTPLELDAGAAAVGESGGARPITLSNCEIDALEIVSVAIEGPDAADFAIVTAPVATQIVPGSSAGWLLELRPTSPGAKAATFRIVHSRGTALIALFGDGLDDSGHAGADPRGSYYACAAGSGDAAAGFAAILVGLAAALGRPRRRRSA